MKDRGKAHPIEEVKNGRRNPSKMRMENFERQTTIEEEYGIPEESIEGNTLPKFSASKWLLQTSFETLFHFLLSLLGNLHRISQFVYRFVHGYQRDAGKEETDSHRESGGASIDRSSQRIYQSDRNRKTELSARF